MIIEFDKKGLEKYLHEMLGHIRFDNASNNVNGKYTLFSIDPKVWKLNQVIINQDLHLPFSTKDEEGSPNDTRAIISNTEYYQDEIDALIENVKSNYSPKGDENFYDEGIRAWIKDYEDNSKKSDDCLSRLSGEISDSYKASISVFFENENEEKTNINCNELLNELPKYLFVNVEKYRSNNEEYRLNKTIFTRELKSWKSVNLSLDTGKDIILVDPYFFHGDEVGDDFGKCELDFLKAICSSEAEKNIVIFYKNCVCAEWLEVFSKKFKCERSKCNLTFVGVKDHKKLHDRFIIGNYRLIFSGHSFPQYFKDEGGKFSANGSIGLSVGSVADRSNEQVMESALLYLQKEILSDGKCYVYGDCTSNLLNINIKPKRGSSEVMEYYQLGKSINCLQWDDTNQCAHWGEKFQIGIKDENKNKIKNRIKNNKLFDGCKIRLCNIKVNTSDKTSSIYKWLAHYYILNHNSES